MFCYCWFHKHIFTMHRLKLPLSPDSYLTSLEKNRLALRLSSWENGDGFNRNIFTHDYFNNNCCKTFRHGLVRRVGGTPNSGIFCIPFRLPFNLPFLVKSIPYLGSSSERRPSQAFFWNVTTAPPLVRNCLAAFNTRFCS